VKVGICDTPTLVPPGTIFARPKSRILAFHNNVGFPDPSKLGCSMSQAREEGAMVYVGDFTPGQSFGE
jgi:hypothetical protein